MARRFEREELLRLRASPLVAKPTSLPPAEEWMGAQPDPNQTPKRIPNRGKSEESAQDGAGTRRPGIDRAFSRTNAPETIVLGPPKTAFASAGSRNATKTSETSTRPSYTDNDEDGAKSERQSFRDRYNKDGARNERDGDKTRESKPENLRLRRDDSERWGNTRAPKTPFDDPERASRRNGDRDYGRDQGSGRDAGRGGRGFDNFRRNGDQEGNGEDSRLRRNGQGRGRNELSRYRDDERPDSDTLEAARNTNRRDWRDRDKGGGHVQDRDFNSGGRPKREPEWMDEPQAEEKKQAHTQEDFQRWKESMKAGKSALEMPASPEPKTNHERSLSGKLANTSKGKAETPLVLDSQLGDGFFGMWGGTKKENTSLSVAEQPKKALGKPSKFTGFFAPKEEVKDARAHVPATAPLPDTTKDPSNEKQNKEDFNRILRLLQSDPSRDTPFRDQPRDVPQSPPAQAPPPNPLESYFNSVPQQDRPRDRPPPRGYDSNSEFLLHLMQQNQINRSTQQPPLEDHPQPSLRGPIPPGLPFSNLMISPQPNQQQPPSTGPPPGFFDLHSDDKLPQRRPQPPPPGFYDDFSPSIHRPPGLDFNPPPQQHRQPPMQPPPGFSSQMRNPSAYPPGLMPGRGQGMPPPGFFGGINAPPGFPPMAFGGNAQDGGFGRGPSEFGDFGGQGQGQGQGGYGR